MKGKQFQIMMTGKKHSNKILYVFWGLFYTDWQKKQFNNLFMSIMVSFKRPVLYRVNVKPNLTLFSSICSHTFVLNSKMKYPNNCDSLFKRLKQAKGYKTYHVPRLKSGLPFSLICLLFNLVSKSKCMIIILMIQC